MFTHIATLVLGRRVSTPRICALPVATRTTTTTKKSKMSNVPTYKQVEAPFFRFNGNSSGSSTGSCSDRTDSGFLSVSVTNTEVTPEKSKKYIVYKLDIKYNEKRWIVLKRYSDFAVLYDMVRL